MGRFLPNQGVKSATWPALGFTHGQPRGRCRGWSLEQVEAIHMGTVTAVTDGLNLWGQVSPVFEF